MIFSTDNTVDENMVLYGENGYCLNGEYASDGIKDLQSCVQQCLGEVECLYVSFGKDNDCVRYKNHNCGFFQSNYVTYQKVRKGAFDDSVSKMCLNLLNNLQI